MKTHNFDYRYAYEILQSPTFKQSFNDVVEILQAITKVPQLPSPSSRKRNKKTLTFTTDQKKLKIHLADQFKQRGWEVSPSITQDKKTKLQADFKKDKIQIEVQFGNMARWYTDVFKFQVSYSLGLIDVGILVVPMQDFADTIDENIAYYERVCRELPYAKMSITLPILVIGIEP